MSDCLFCKIIDGSIPSYTVYEDDNVKVFLDINPNNDGHLLVIPKEHKANLYEMDDDTLIYMLNMPFAALPCLMLNLYVKYY